MSWRARFLTVVSSEHGPFITARFLKPDQTIEDITEGDGQTYTITGVEPEQMEQGPNELVMAFKRRVWSLVDEANQKLDAAILEQVTNPKISE